MGCWNKTCAITQFPILADDPTVNFAIVQSDYSIETRPSYINGNGWNLIPVPFYGVYDDYGWQEDDDGQQPKYDFLASKYKEDLIEVESEKNRAKTCYPNLKAPFANCQSLGDTIHGNVWNLESWRASQHPDAKARMLGDFMISRIAWDKLTEKTLVTYPKRRWFTRDEIAKEIEAYGIHYKQMLDIYEKVQALPSKSDASSDDYVIHFAIEMARKYSGMDTIATSYVDEKFGAEHWNNSAASAIAWASRRGFDSGVDFAPIDGYLAGALTAHDVASMYILINSMNRLRKTFHPMSYEGSQSDYDYTHGLLVSAMRDMIKFNKHKYD